MGFLGFLLGIIGFGFGFPFGLFLGFLIFIRKEPQDVKVMPISIPFLRLSFIFVVDQWIQPYFEI